MIALMILSIPVRLNLRILTNFYVFVNICYYACACTNISANKSRLFVSYKVAHPMYVPNICLLFIFHNCKSITITNESLYVETG